MAHKIQWLNIPGHKGETWNPIIGCSKVSEGCENCYAERMAFRLAAISVKTPRNPGNYLGVTNYPKQGWNGKTSFEKDRLTDPLHWRDPRVVFVCSMGDLFHETASFEEIDSVFSVMSDCDKHIYIILTKRPERMFDFYQYKKNLHFGIPWQPKDNIWLGVSAENQEEASNRLHWLNEITAAVKIVSVEPMLGAIDLNKALGNTLKYFHGGLKNCLSWVICGGESGHKARPLHPDWVRSIRDQCKDANVPFFFKQWGEYQNGSYNELSSKEDKNIFMLNDGKTFKVEDYKVMVDIKKITTEYWNKHNATAMVKVGKHKSGNLLDGVKYEEYPKV